MSAEYDQIATVRGIIRMAALVVMDEVGETDRALATAIAAKAALDLRTHFTPSPTDRCGDCGLMRQTHPVECCPDGFQVTPTGQSTTTGLTDGLTENSEGSTDE